MLIKKRPNKTSKHRIKNREHVIRALDLRTAGASYDAIGKAMDISKTRAYQLVKAGLDELNQKVLENAETVRALEAKRLDAMMMGLWPNRQNPRNADTILRLMERRAKLLGLDAPAKHDFSVHPPEALIFTGPEELSVEDSE